MRSLRDSSRCAVRVHERAGRLGGGQSSQLLLLLRYDLPQVRKVNKGTECGVILSDTTDLAKGDVLTCYEVVQRKVGIYDSVSEEGADQQKRTTSDDDDDDDS